MAMLANIFFSGCSLGFVPTNLESTKPYLLNWIKEGVTPEDRREDSFACGGSRNDSQPFSRGNEEEQMLPGETIWETRERLGIEWANCMKNKGYRYLS